MFKSISKLVLVFTVLSALVGQAMAVDTMSFEMAIDNKHYNVCKHRAAGGGVAQDTPPPHFCLLYTSPSPRDPW